MDDIVEYLRMHSPAATLAAASGRQDPTPPPDDATTPSPGLDGNTIEILRKLLSDKATLAALLRLAGKH